MKKYSNYRLRYLSNVATSFVLYLWFIRAISSNVTNSFSTARPNRGKLRCFYFKAVHPSFSFRGIPKFGYIIDKTFCDAILAQWWTFIWRKRCCFLKICWWISHLRNIQINTQILPWYMLWYSVDVDLKYLRWNFFNTSIMNLLSDDRTVMHFLLYPLIRWLLSFCSVTFSNSIDIAADKAEDTIITSHARTPIALALACMHTQAGTHERARMRASVALDRIQSLTYIYINTDAHAHTRTHTHNTHVNW